MIDGAVFKYLRVIENGKPIAKFDV